MKTEQMPPAVAGPVERRVSQHFNGLTPAEAERLALLAEECGEVIQAIGKVLRHGYESRHPYGEPDKSRGIGKRDRGCTSRHNSYG
jgi:hypothetical protein